MAEPDPWDAPSSRHPPDQPLPKLAELANFALNKLTPVLQKLEPIVGPLAYRWGQAKLDDIKSKFKPAKLSGGMGCMLACYDVLGILYGGKRAEALRKELYARALAQAKEDARQHPDRLAKAIEQVIAEAEAKGKPLEREPKWHALHAMTSPYNTSDHLFELMREKGLAGDRVQSPNADAEATIRNMAAEGPGVYFFGLAVNDNHTVTLGVERAADGSQKMYWLDQRYPGQGKEIPPGQLGAELEDVHGYRSTTNIYPYGLPMAAP